jgi:signal transduction histidine kinase/DNA-binding response OmpR family regulator
MKRGLVLVLFLVPFFSSSQTPVVDSLKRLLIIDDSYDQNQRIDILNKLADQVKVFDPALSFDYARQAFAQSQKIGYVNGEGWAELTLADYYWMRTEYVKSLEHSLSALKNFENTSNQSGLMNGYMILGLSYRDLKDTAKFSMYSKKALRIASEIGDSSMIAKVYNVWGLEQNQVRKQLDAGLEYFTRALAFAEHDDAFVKPNILANIGACYENTDHEKALGFHSRALGLAKFQNNKRAECNIHLQLGDAYKEMRKYDLAEEHYSFSIRLAKELVAKRLLMNSYISLIELKMKVGDSEGAHRYQVRYATSRDSLFNAEKAAQIAEMEARYEAAKKEKTISVLTAEKGEQIIWRNALISGVIVSILASFYIYRLQRSRAMKIKELLNMEQMFNDKLKEIDKLKSGFFANISHEFRTPLTLILAPLEDLLKKKVTGKERDVLLLMKRSCGRLLELVNQLLDLSKLESGKMQLKVKLGNIVTFHEMITSSFSSLAEQRKINYVNKIMTGNERIWFDPDKLEKIILNLLSNAFKFTPAKGTVTLEMSLREESTLLITVSDTGSGIPLGEQEDIFLPFYQTQQTSENFVQGTGLGLPLVKELVRVYGGTIRLESVVSQGTTFFIELPVRKSAFAADQILESEWQQGNGLLHTGSIENSVVLATHEEIEDALMVERDSVLIVEDNIEMLNFIATKMKEEFTVLTATDGQQALQSALKNVPSLVLSDLMMPKLDGQQLAEKLKTDERTSHIPIVLLTAKNEPQSRLDGFKAGIDDYITKPFSTEELMARVRNLVAQRKKIAEKFRERILLPASPSAEISMDDRFLLKVKQVIEAQMGDFTFSVERLAEELNLSRAQLFRKQKALTGFSPAEFIKELRLKRAADMISKKVDTITQIGYAVGFSDQSYFTKCFKKQFGMTPSEYSTTYKSHKSQPLAH